jgi:hypothetical protein
VREGGTDLEPTIEEAPLEFQGAIERRFLVQDLESEADPNPIDEFLSVAHVNTSG